MIQFQSTRPLRGATDVRWVSRAASCDFNPRAPYGARRDQGHVLALLDGISIHAPLTGRDSTCRAQYSGRKKFQSTRPLRGATSAAATSRHISIGFQSTRPLRGATASSESSITAISNFNPRAPYGARQMEQPTIKIEHLFQSTRPLRGATDEFVKYTDFEAVFQSTRPLRGATVDRILSDLRKIISIHAPLTGRDWRMTCLSLITV